MSRICMSDIRCASWNVNGIQNLHRKGFLKEFLLEHPLDILCLSEIKVQVRKLIRRSSLHKLLRAFGLEHCYWHPMTRGYGGLHGTAILCRHRPSRVLCGWAHVALSDLDGRVITAVFPSFVLVNTYVPCSSYPDRKMTSDARARKCLSRQVNKNQEESMKQQNDCK